ncbi:Hypothetical predicted protein [Olea europaea subsp. europaea]|uniref:Uncharacterized protein n=1 Tax=Olea europaea subsp. europaea TaxID=158383 RepID=A0A8S0VLB6_OLEEU|nr:Hypothetical predicted protein [Olea europaea subsp. europaea]
MSWVGTRSRSEMEWRFKRKAMKTFWIFNEKDELVESDPLKRDLERNSAYFLSNKLERSCINTEWHCPLQETAAHCWRSSSQQGDREENFYNLIYRFVKKRIKNIKEKNRNCQCFTPRDRRLLPETTATAQR